MSIPVYKLQIVHAETGHVATFNGRGMVERDLMAAVEVAILERVPAMLEGLPWYWRFMTPSQLRNELEKHVPELTADAVNAVVLAVKEEATAKM